jgi:hypothetical protein
MSSAVIVGDGGPKTTTTPLWPTRVGDFHWLRIVVGMS